MKNKLFLFLLLLQLPAVCQVVSGVDTLKKSGPINKRINLVIISEGYTTAELPQFTSDANTLYNYLLNTAPFSYYKDYFNVFAIKCQSPQSGVSHPGTATDVVEPVSPILSVVNSFNSTFDSFSIHRLLTAMNSLGVYSVLAANFPAYDQALILANSTVYGGSGGPYAVSSIHPSSPEIVAHEIGHSFAGLADEYWAGQGYAMEKPNMTANSNSLTARWSQWMGTGGVGLYPYGTTAPENGWYRPHQNCKMFNLFLPYCPVCQQTIIERIHTLTNPIDAYTPGNGTPITYTATTAPWFKATLLKPNPNTLKRSWKLNAGLVASNVDSLQLNSNQLVNGTNSLLLTVIDTTILSRDTAHHTLHTYSVLWNISYSRVGVGIKEVSAQLALSMFPNPASDLLNLEYTLLSDAEISLAVSDMSGKTVIRERGRKEAAGGYKKEIDVSSLKEGSYILTLKLNEQTINHQFVIFH